MYKVRFRPRWSFSRLLMGSEQAIKGQLDRDKEITELLDTMKDVYGFVEDVKKFPDKIDRLEDTILQILGQTVECSFFIREYCGHGFGGMNVMFDHCCE